MTTISEVNRHNSPLLCHRSSRKNLKNEQPRLQATGFSFIHFRVRQLANANSNFNFNYHHQLMNQICINLTNNCNFANLTNSIILYEHRQPQKGKGKNEFALKAHGTITQWQQCSPNFANITTEKRRTSNFFFRNVFP